MSDYYNAGSVPSTGSPGNSALIRAEFLAIANGISDKLPPLSGAANKVVVINGSGTGMSTVIVDENYVGLGDVDNTSDAAKPVSTAQAAAIDVVADAKANKGANSDITSLSGLTTALSISQGGTGATAQSTARTALDVYSKAETDTEISDALAAVNVAQIQPLTAVCVGNDLVITLGATKLDFRSTTLSSGAVTTVTTTTPTVLTVVNGATLGTTNGVSSRVEVVAMNNAGALELAASVKSGGATVDDSALVSTTAMSTGADSTNTVYSTAARTFLAQRYVGFVEISEATAGVWASQPTKVQGAGGTVTQSVPPARSWKSPTRVAATTYTNDAFHERQVIIYGTQVAGFSASLTITVDGSTLLISSGADGNGGQFRPSATFTVPAGSTYSAAVTLTSIASWKELD